MYRETNLVERFLPYQTLSQDRNAMRHETVQFLTIAALAATASKPASANVAKSE